MKKNEFSYENILDTKDKVKDNKRKYIYLYTKNFIKSHCIVCILALYLNILS